MKRGAALLLLLLAMAATARGATPESRLLVEVDAGRNVRYAGERFDIAIKIGIDRAFFVEQAVPLFRPRMDIPLSVAAPWLAEATGFGIAPPEAPADTGHGRPLSLVVNDEVVRATRRADRTIDGETFAILETTRSFLALAPGTTRLTAPVVSFAYSTEFRDDFIHGRVPVDPKTVVVRGPAITIEVRTPPAEGRPPGYTNAVGRFTVSATAGAGEVETGESVRVRLVVEGEGNLAEFEPPPALDLPGFHPFGRLSEFAGGRRILTYDVAPMNAAVDSVPAIAFAFFDPTPPARYRVATTAPIPLVVTGKGDEMEAPHVTADAESNGGSSLFIVIAAGFALAALIAVFVARSRRRTPAEEPGPAEAFREAIGRPGADPAVALADYLAARLGCSPAAVVSPDLESHLAQAGMSATLAARTAREMESLVAARYEGPAPELPEVEARDAPRRLVLDIEQEWSRAP